MVRLFTYFPFSWCYKKELEAYAFGCCLVARLMWAKKWNLRNLIWLSTTRTSIVRQGQAFEFFKLALQYFRLNPRKWLQNIFKALWKVFCADNFKFILEGVIIPFVVELVSLKFFDTIFEGGSFLVYLPYFFMFFLLKIYNEVQKISRQMIFFT